MTPTLIRLECLKLAHQYAAPGATLHDIFERTRELEGFVGRACAAPDARESAQTWVNTTMSAGLMK